MGQEGQPGSQELERDSLGVQTDLATMQSDEILMHATLQAPVPGALTANPMYDAPARGVSGVRQVLHLPGLAPSLQPHTGTHAN